MTYRIRRYIAYLCITIFVVSLPFIHIGGNQIFLLSFDHKELHLFGSVFSMQELYVMPFLLILLFVGIFFATTLLGRVWCGWGCPQTIFRVIYRDLIQGTLFKLNKISNKQAPQDLSSFQAKLKKMLAFLLIIPLCFSASAVLLFYFVPPSDFFTYLQNPKDHLVLLGFWIGIGSFFVFDITFLKEIFCVYICPYCRVQSVLFDDNTQSVIYDEKRGGVIYNTRGEKNPAPSKTKSGECIDCQKCVRVCPTHIDIRKGMQLECINCLECADACSSVMQKTNQPSLIQWSSANAIAKGGKVLYVRAKTIGYSLILGIAIFCAFVVGSKKDDLLLNITRPTSLYTIHTGGRITNEYILLVENLTQSDEVLHFSIQESEFKIIRPMQSISIQKGHKKRVIFVLEYQGSVQNVSSDLSIPVTIAISSTNNPNLSIQKKTVFIYPKEQK